MFGAWCLDPSAPVSLILVWCQGSCIHAPFFTFFVSACIDCSFPHPLLLSHVFGCLWCCFWCSRWLVSVGRVLTCHLVIWVHRSWVLLATCSCVMFCVNTWLLCLFYVPCILLSIVYPCSSCYLIMSSFFLTCSFSLSFLFPSLFIILVFSVLCQFVIVNTLMFGFLSCPALLFLCLVVFISFCFFFEL